MNSSCRFVCVFDSTLKCTNTVAVSIITRLNIFTLILCIQFYGDPETSDKKFPISLSFLSLSANVTDYQSFVRIFHWLSGDELTECIHPGKCVPRCRVSFLFFRSPGLMHKNALASGYRLLNIIL